MAHEDGGMMGQFLVVNSNPVLNSHHSSSLVIANIFPNPSTGKNFISCDKDCNLKVYNTIGQCILSQSIKKGKTELTLPNKGLLLFVFDHHGIQTIKKQLMIE
jgi:hypothetical protein